MRKAVWLKIGVFAMVMGVMLTGYGGLCKKKKSKSGSSGLSANIDILSITPPSGSSLAGQNNSFSVTISYSFTGIDAEIWGGWLHTDGGIAIADSGLFQLAITDNKSGTYTFSWTDFCLYLYVGKGTDYVYPYKFQVWIRTADRTLYNLTEEEAIRLGVRLAYDQAEAVYFHTE